MFRAVQDLRLEHEDKGCSQATEDQPGDPNADKFMTPRLGGSFSAVSTPIFTIKYSFCRIFQNLENKISEFSKFLKIFEKIRRILQNFADSPDFAEFYKILQNFLEIFAKICKILAIF